MEAAHKKPLRSYFVKHYENIERWDLVIIEIYKVALVSMIGRKHTEII